MTLLSKSDLKVHLDENIFEAIIFGLRDHTVRNRPSILELLRDVDLKVVEIIFNACKYWIKSPSKIRYQTIFEVLQKL